MDSQDRPRSATREAIVALYERFEDARQAIIELQDEGFSAEDIGLMTNDDSGGDAGVQAAGGVERVTEHRDVDQRDHVASGAGVGAVLGGAVGLLAGLVSLVFPGVGPLIVAGPILSALTGAGLGAATGGLVGALASAGVPAEDVDRFAEGVRRGGTLVMVHPSQAITPERWDRARAILNRHDPAEVRLGGPELRGESLPGTATNTQAQVGDDSFVREDVLGDRAEAKDDASQIRTTSEDAIATSQTNVLASDRGDWKSEMGVSPGSSFADDEGYYRREYEQHYAALGASYGLYRRAYEYGHEYGLRPEYRGRNWDQLAGEAQRQWQLQYPNSPWDDFKEAIRTGWERVTRR